MIIPALDIIGGKIVRLYQGIYKNKTFYNDNFYELISKYISYGAKQIHIVDLDGCKNIKNKQNSLFSKLTIHNKVIYQVGGGIRKDEDIDFLLSLGISRVVIGTIAIINPEILKQWLKKYGSDKIVLSVDVKIRKDNKKKEVAIHGWKKLTKISLEDLLNEFLPFNLKHVLCTDISKDGTLLGPNLVLYKELVSIFPKIEFQASGGVYCLKNIYEIKKTGVHQLIIGKALLEKKFNVQEAINCWQNG